jgi:hypothetical protein
MMAPAQARQSPGHLGLAEGAAAAHSRAERLIRSRTTWSAGAIVLGTEPAVRLTRVTAVGHAEPCDAEIKVQVSQRSRS